MNKGAVSYDPEVWFFLKAIWEAVPKISFQKLCEVVADILKKPVPTSSVVGRRCRSEKWVKSVRAYCRKADRTLEDYLSRLLKDIKKEYEKIQQDKKDFAIATHGDLLPKQDSPDHVFEHLEKVANINRKTASVLLEHRRRAGKIGQLLDDSMDWMYEAKEAVMDETNKTPEEMERARRQFGLLEQMVEKIESFARTAKHLQQTDFLLFGINTDDTRDSVTDGRVEQIKDDTKFDQAKADLEQQYEAMQKQISWIQSGGFESETLAEMEEKMKQEEAEDAEFFEVDNED